MAMKNTTTKKTAKKPAAAKARKPRRSPQDALLATVVRLEKAANQWEQVQIQILRSLTTVVSVVIRRVSDGADVLPLKARIDAALRRLAEPLQLVIDRPEATGRNCGK